MFKSLTIVGSQGTVNRGYQTAAVLGQWRIEKREETGWTLRADVSRVDRFRLSQRDLYMTAPRMGGGDWYFTVRDISVVDGKLRAVLSPPSASWEKR